LNRLKIFFFQPDLEPTLFFSLHTTVAQCSFNLRFVLDYQSMHISYFIIFFFVG